MKKNNIILKTFIVLSIICVPVSSINANTELISVDDSNYIEVQSGGKEERKLNDKIIASFNEVAIKQTRGWRESCYPQVPTCEPPPLVEVMASRNL